MTVGCTPPRRCRVLISGFFFFQAEDGIRDGHVTGVQTCALPICRAPCPTPSRRRRLSGRPHRRPADRLAPARAHPRTSRRRSEERRVGKECRARWSPSDVKKKERGKGRSKREKRTQARTAGGTGR